MYQCMMIAIHSWLLPHIANFFSPASPGHESLGLSSIESGLLDAQEDLLLCWTDACRKQFALRALWQQEYSQDYNAMIGKGFSGV